MVLLARRALQERFTTKGRDADGGQGIEAGCRVAVLGGRQFPLFSAGDTGEVVRVDREALNCDVHFEGASHPVPVALRHLKLVAPASALNASATMAAALRSSSGSPSRPSLASSVRWRREDDEWEDIAAALDAKALEDARAAAAEAESLPHHMNGSACGSAVGHSGMHARVFVSDGSVSTAAAPEADDAMDLQLSRTAVAGGTGGVSTAGRVESTDEWTALAKLVTGGSGGDGGPPLPQFPPQDVGYPLSNVRMHEDIAGTGDVAAFDGRLVACDEGEVVVSPLMESGEGLTSMPSCKLIGTGMANGLPSACGSCVVPRDVHPASARQQGRGEGGTEGTGGTVFTFGDTVDLVHNAAMAGAGSMAAVESMGLEACSTAVAGDEQHVRGLTAQEQCIRVEALEARLAMLEERHRAEMASLRSALEDALAFGRQQEARASTLEQRLRTMSTCGLQTASASHQGSPSGTSATSPPKEVTSIALTPQTLLGSSVGPCEPFSSSPVRVHSVGDQVVARRGARRGRSVSGPSCSGGTASGRGARPTTGVAIYSPSSQRLLPQSARRSLGVSCGPRTLPQQLSATPQVAGVCTAGSSLPTTAPIPPSPRQAGSVEVAPVLARSPALSVGSGCAPSLRRMASSPSCSTTLGPRPSTPTRAATAAPQSLVVEAAGLSTGSSRRALSASATQPHSHPASTCRRWRQQGAPRQLFLVATPGAAAAAAGVRQSSQPPGGMSLSRTTSVLEGASTPPPAPPPPPPPALAARPALVAGPAATVRPPTTTSLATPQILRGMSAAIPSGSVYGAGAPC